MVEIKAKKIDISLEKRIVTGLIVSKKVVTELYPRINTNYMQSSFTRIVSEWALEYFSYYEEPCGLHISDIFEEKSREMELSEVEIIREFLTELSEQYSILSKINDQYVIDQAILYFTKREVDIRSGNARILLEQGKIKEAEDQLIGYKKVIKNTSDWVNPKDEKNIQEVFDPTFANFIEFPKDLGRLIGVLEREYFIAGAGAFKVGKTWWLEEWMVQGVLCDKKVALFSLEMTKKKMNERIYKRYVGSANEKEKEEIYPCFDCELNQEGTCNRIERTNPISLWVNNTKPPFDPSLEYRPCTWCREFDPRNYQPTTWFEVIKRPPFDFSEVRRKMQSIPDLMRIKFYPKFSANTSDIRRDLDYLEYSEGFIPDIIIVDYADILAPEDKRKSGTEQLDDTWKSLGRLVGERHALVLTVTQVTREALEKVDVKRGHIAGWIGKLAHVDAMYSLNQTANEKEDGIIRIGTIVKRHEDYDENLFCHVLQNLNLGQVHLDSQLVRRRTS